MRKFLFAFFIFILSVDGEVTISRPLAIIQDDLDDLEAELTCSDIDRKSHLACFWISPLGLNCDEDETCAAEDDGNGNCSAIISKVYAEKHEGRWTCRFITGVSLLGNEFEDASTDLFVIKSSPRPKIEPKVENVVIDEEAQLIPFKCGIPSPAPKTEFKWLFKGEMIQSRIIEAEKANEEIFDEIEIEINRDDSRGRIECEVVKMTSDEEQIFDIGNAKYPLSEVAQLTPKIVDDFSANITIEANPAPNSGRVIDQDGFVDAEFRCGNETKCIVHPDIGLNITVQKQEEFIYLISIKVIDLNFGGNFSFEFSNSVGRVLSSSRDLSTTLTSASTESALKASKASSGTVLGVSLGVGLLLVALALSAVVGFVVLMKKDALKFGEYDVVDDFTPERETEL